MSATAVPAAAGRAIAAAVEQSLPDYVALFQRLLRVPTPRNREHAALAIVAASLRGCGIEVAPFAGRPAGSLKDL